MTTYQLPGEVYAGIMTGRRELVDVLVKKLERDERTLSPKEQSELLRWIADAVEARQTDRQKIEELQRRLKEYWRMAEGLSTQLQSLLADTNDIAND